MKYKLIKPIVKEYSTIEQILTNRGIPIEQIPHYLNPTYKDVNDPELLGIEQLRDGAAALTTAIQLNQNICVVVDADCDGFTSSALLINYLYDLFPNYVLNHVKWFLHTGKQHGLEDTLFYILNPEKGFKLVICPDSSSNDYEFHLKLKQAGITTLVLDHHETDQIDPNAIIINNQLSAYPNKDLSGVGVTWQFCRFIDKILGGAAANDYLDLVALGDLADMMSMRQIETKYLITEGLKDDHVKNPFIVYMAEKNTFSLKGKLTPIGVAFYIAPFVNAIVRSGTLEEKELVFNSMLKFKAFEKFPSTKRGHALGEEEKLVEQAVRTATNVKARQTKAQNDSLKTIEDKIESEHLLNHKVLLFLVEPGEIDPNIAGLVANKIMTKYQRPVCILTKIISDEGLISYQGSARGCDVVDVTNFKDICTSSNQILFAAGHQSAFGLSIAAENIQGFIQYTDEVLKDIKTEPIYYVDYIFQENNLSNDKILEIANMENLWGKDIDESKIAVEHIKLSPDMVTVYDKKGYTIKINLPSGAAAMLFNAKEEDVLKLQTNNSGYVELNIIGKCNMNEWNNNITPQIFIEDYEIIDSNKYFF